MSEISDIRKAFSAKGYARIATEGIDLHEIWYRHSRSTEQVEHILSLEFKPAAKAYNVRVGVVCPEARSLVEEVIPTILQFISPIHSEFKKFFLRKCWRMFDAGRALNWKSVYVMPDPHERDQWPILFDDLFENFIIPIFFKIEYPCDIAKLLYLDTPPFEWQLGIPVLRAAEIIAIGRVSGIERHILKKDLANFRNVIEPQIYGSLSFEVVIETLIKKIFDVQRI